MALERLGGLGGLARDQGAKMGGCDGWRGAEVSDCCGSSFGGGRGRRRIFGGVCVFVCRFFFGQNKKERKKIEKLSKMIKAKILHK